jgi:large subunit ribosomal protein L13Ae
MLKFKSFEGIPHPYDKMKRMVVPEALRVVRLRPGRKYTNLGKLAGMSGWKHEELIGQLEEKRKVKSKAFYEQKKAKAALKAKAEVAAAGELAKVTAVLEGYGYN